MKKLVNKNWKKTSKKFNKKWFRELENIFVKELGKF